MKNYFLHLKYWQRGLTLGISLFVVLLANDVFRLIRGFSGSCWDVLSENAVKYSCSLAEYIFRDPIKGIFGSTNVKLVWPIYIGVIILPALIAGMARYIIKMKDKTDQKGRESEQESLIS